MEYSGLAYTWTNKRFTTNPTFQRLDRCLANAEWCAKFPRTAVFHLPMIYSDHAPILAILDSHSQKAKKPFRFENWWLLEDDFSPIAANSWRQTTSKPFHTRTKILATDIKTWRKKKNPLNQQLQQIEHQVLQQQNLPPDKENHKLQATLFQNHEALLTKDAIFHRQRVRKLWATDGDRNTQFFQQAILKRDKKNIITHILDAQGNSVVTSQDIANIFIDYFQNLFASQVTHAANPNEHSHPVTILEEYTMSAPDEKEILDLIREMKKNASPGPDGLNVAFYRAAWPWIKQDIMELVTDFYIIGNLHPDLKTTYIVLVPKKNAPNHPQDFRPISLSNVIYKILAKSLANRLKMHLPDYIHASQTAFIKGRRITTNIILAQEIVHTFRLSAWKNKGFLIKIDLAKDFDRIEWNFLLHALRRQGFHGHFIDLVYQCIFVATFSVLING
ncbi:hypothetical protein PR202_gb27437 [Eleusine coracana subsp. coracana]|uniref:Reverse transcriptase domain-containing protein n=1 Tax=Eleusine coracana subsp. coracana TaxID=191504 RepID=A0AAV5FW14_ELECO|nr:hypothetical protein PR202_gb27437 [Eleusine coracana subsp. coracana]